MMISTAASPTLKETIRPRPSKIRLKPIAITIIPSASGHGTSPPETPIASRLPRVIPPSGAAGCGCAHRCNRGCAGDHAYRRSQDFGGCERRSSAARPAGYPGRPPAGQKASPGAAPARQVRQTGWHASMPITITEAVWVKVTMAPSAAASAHSRPADAAPAPKLPREFRSTCPNRAVSLVVAIVRGVLPDSFKPHSPCSMRLRPCFGIGHASLPVVPARCLDLLAVVAHHTQPGIGWPTYGLPFCYTLDRTLDHLDRNAQVARSTRGLATVPVGVAPWPRLRDVCLCSYKRVYEKSAIWVWTYCMTNASIGSSSS